VKPDRARVLIRFQELQNIQETADCFGTNCSMIYKILKEENVAIPEGQHRRFTRYRRFPEAISTFRVGPSR
jgi:hypothetical protein